MLGWKKSLGLMQARGEGYGGGRVWCERGTQSTQTNRQDLIIGSETFSVQVSPSHLALPCIALHGVTSAPQSRAAACTGTRLLVIHQVLQLQRQLVLRRSHEKLVTLHIQGHVFERGAGHNHAHLMTRQQQGVTCND